LRQTWIFQPRNTRPFEGAEATTSGPSPREAGQEAQAATPPTARDVWMVEVVTVVCNHPTLRGHHASKPSPADANTNAGAAIPPPRSSPEAGPVNGQVATPPSPTLRCMST
ncbi:hypothetical protein T484DRAFT_1774351, partial [Baffinella frigidus]